MNYELITKNTPRAATRRTAFTLMEVNIALLLVAIGLTALLSLMPVGLRQSDLATADTAQAAFATAVFNAMHANAATITNWTQWTQFTNIMTGINAPIAGGTSVAITNGIGEINDYVVRGHYIKYKLQLANGADGLGTSASPIKRAWLRSTDRRFASVTNSPVYATAFVYMGM